MKEITESGEKGQIIVKMDGLQDGIGKMFHARSWSTVARTFRTT